MCSRFGVLKTAILSAGSGVFLQSDQWTDWGHANLLLFLLLISGECDPVSAFLDEARGACIDFVDICAFSISFILVEMGRMFWLDIRTACVFPLISLLFHSLLLFHLYCSLN